VIGSANAFKDELLAAIPALRAFAVSLCGSVDRADDLVQETLMKAWENMSIYTPGTNIRAWLFTILRNTFYSQHRKRRHEVNDAGQTAATLSTPPDQIAHLDFADLHIALQKLPPDQREALILVGASGHSYEAAAEICNCKVGTIKSRVSRGRTRLGELLGLDATDDFSADQKWRAALDASPSLASCND